MSFHAITGFIGVADHLLGKAISVHFTQFSDQCFITWRNKTLHVIYGWTLGFIYIKSHCCQIV